MHFFFNATSTPEIYTLSLHDALPISVRRVVVEDSVRDRQRPCERGGLRCAHRPHFSLVSLQRRSEEHTSELQSRVDLVCRLLLEKKKNTDQIDRQFYV